MTRKESHMTNKIALPPNTIIIYGLALADALTIAYGLVALDSVSVDFLSRFFIVGRGLFVGGFGGLALAITANKIPRARAKSEKIAGWSAFGVVLAAIVAIVAPVTFANMNPAITAAVHPVIRVIVSFASGLLVPALTAAVAFTSGRLDTESKDESTGQSERAKPQAQPSKAAPLYSCSACSWTSAEAERAKRDPLKAFSGHKVKHGKGTLS